jgi:hypothetical protein
MPPIGFGIFTWSAYERQSGRYGTFFLTPSDLGESVVRPVGLDVAALSALEGLQVRITLRVTESRTSEHQGDQALKVFPGQPARPGSMIELGVGRLVLEDQSDFPPETHPTQVGIGLAPSDGRSNLWLNPTVLYRLLDQTVELFIDPSSAPESAPSPLADLAVEDGVYLNEDGCTMQIRGTALAAASLFAIVPDVDPTPSGCSLRGPAMKPGTRLSAIPVLETATTLN